ncbi:hypothetical protein K474DRAFT_1755673 [Panus rudis PR-1116 ss-1]|nr:hypothetical protein K474DRAFT_1755673 [Panus rudis PR-1116 ss-1]
MPLRHRERGHDPTAVRASSEEYQKLKDAVADFVDYCQSKGWDAEYVKKTLIDDHSPYVITLSGNRRVVINKPFFQARSACGRATRVLYAAYDLESKELRALKDAWRTNSVGVQSEEEKYKYLEEKGVHFLATTYFVGDIWEGDGITAGKQITHTDTLSSPTFRPHWKKVCKLMCSLVHTRVLQELRLPLYSMANSKEVVSAVRNAVECAYEAREKADTCHRDISVSNVLVNKRGEGFLNDWDHGQILTRVKEPHQYNTGTWQFVSIDFLRNRRKPQNIQDDVESSFWVLLYVCLHYLCHDRPRFNLEFFDEKDAGQDENEDTVVGGLKKKSLLTNDRVKVVKWECEPLKDLILNFSGVLGDYHTYSDSTRARSIELAKPIIYAQIHSRALPGCFEQDRLASKRSSQGSNRAPNRDKAGKG